MTDTFEARLVGYSKQSRKDGDWVEVRFHIHPDDVTPALANAPLKTTFGIAAVPIDEAQKITVTQVLTGEKKSLTASQRCALVCQDEMFQGFIARMHRTNSGTDKLIPTAEAVRNTCDVKSRAEFDTDPAAFERWNKLKGEYLVWKAGV